MNKQKLSLQAQLLQAGLVSSAKAKTIKSDKHKQTQQQRNNKAELTNEATELATQAHAEQLKKDRELNLARHAAENKKQLLAQVKQLVEQHKLARDDDGIAYHFNDDGKVKTLYVSESMREQLISGQFAIVKAEQDIEVVSSEIAQKIASRNLNSVLVHNKPVEKVDDAYAAYEIPDDLLW